MSCACNCHGQAAGFAACNLGPADGGCRADPDLHDGIKAGINSSPEITADEQARCQRGPRCRHADQKRRAAYADRAFCHACEQALDSALSTIPRRYAELHLHTARPITGTVNSSGYITGSHAPPVPIDVGIISLGDDLAWMLTAWDAIVRDIADLSLPAYSGEMDRYERTTRRARQGPIVAAAARLLRAHTAVWLAAGQHDIPGSRDLTDPGDPTLPDRRVTPTGTYQPMTGPQAAGWVLDWHGRVRARLGHTRLTNRIHAPCPACGVEALTRLDGDDLVSCQDCGKAWTMDNFAVFTTAWHGAPKAAAG